MYMQVFQPVTFSHCRPKCSDVETRQPNKGYIQSEDFSLLRSTTKRDVVSKVWHTKMCGCEEGVSPSP